MTYHCHSWRGLKYWRWIYVICFVLWETCMWPSTGLKFFILSKLLSCRNFHSCK